MFRDHPICIKPEDENVKIWRYLDLTKFLSILNKNALFFSRIDQLGDPFEGSLPNTEGQELLEHIKQLPRNINSLPESERPYTLTYYLRKTCYAYSFHVNSFESAALWSIYTKSQQGVAIQSTYKRLCESFSEYSENDVSIGLIKYIDYISDKIPVYQNMLTPLLCKRKSFEYEMELRAIIFFPSQFQPSYSEDYYGVDLSNQQGFHKHIQNYPPGFYVPVNLKILIEKIYIAPTTKPWIRDIISSLIKKFEINKEIHQSDLDKEPII